jgi:transcriptional regulator with XRE-family HTH domain
MNAVAVRFGENLRRLRKRADVSQETLGFRAELHRTEIGLLERGARVPRIDTIVKIAAGLDVAPAVLLAGIAWIPGTPGTITHGAFSIGDSSGATE